MNFNNIATMSYLKSILDAMYTEITTDASLATVCGGAVRLRYKIAEYNESFPYMVWMIRDHRMTDDSLVEWARLDIDVWTYNSDHVQALNIVNHLRRLLHKKIVVTTEGSCRVWLDRSFDIPVDRDDNFKEPTIGRRKVVFWLRMIDKNVAADAAY